MSVLTPSESKPLGKIVKEACDSLNPEVRFLVRSKFGVYAVIEEYLGEVHCAYQGIGCLMRASAVLEGLIREYEEYRAKRKFSHNVDVL